MAYTPGPAYETPPSDHQPPAGDPARYGQVGQTPWTFAQTVRGTVATLAPWLIFIIGTQLLSARAPPQASGGSRQWRISLGASSPFSSQASSSWRS